MIRCIIHLTTYISNCCGSPVMIFLLVMPHYMNITIGNSARVRDQTPIKSRWLMMLLMHEISQTSNISNKHMKNVLSLYIKDKFLTNSLLQNAKNQAKIELFGLTHINVQYATALRDQMEAEGHKSCLLSRMPCTFI